MRVYLRSQLAKRQDDRLKGLVLLPLSPDFDATYGYSVGVVTKSDLAAHRQLVWIDRARTREEAAGLGFL